MSVRVLYQEVNKDGQAIALVEECGTRNITFAQGGEPKIFLSIDGFAELMKPAAFFDKLARELPPYPVDEPEAVEAEIVDEAEAEEAVDE